MILVIGTPIIAQDLPSEVNVIPPSPNVSALNKYIEVPVSQYTGVPNISIPIYTIRMQQLSLPIGLSYHASGLKVEEYASWVGAGWSLSAGGTVNRSVRGLPDEFLPGLSTLDPGKKGYFFNDKLFDSESRINLNWLTIDDAETSHVVTPSGPVSTPDSLASGFLDTQPDLYNFSYPGGSGKFVFSRAGGVMTFSKDDTKFIKHPYDGPSLPMAGYTPSPTGYVWTLEAPDGTRYKYTKAETTITYGGCGTTLPENYDPDFGHQSAWHLEEISLNGEWIRFEYITEEILYSMRASVTENFKISGSGSPSNSTCTSTLETKTQRLTRIYTSNGIEVKFIANNDRLDLPGSHNLERIEVRHGNKDVSFHRLNHDYFGTDKKLKLISVNQENVDGTQELLGQAFTYFEDAPFPALDSNNQDYWGFNNGANNEAFLIPSFKREGYHVNQASTVNRDPELSTARIGTLQKITYPTGGNTSFEYELNSYFDENYLKTHVYQVSAQGTGTPPNVQPDTETTLPFVINHDTYMTLTTNDEVGGQLLRLVGSEYQVVSSLTPVGNRFELPIGTYKLRASSLNENTANVKIEYEQMEPSSVTVGGLRIKRITTLDPETGDVLKKSYEYTQEGSGESSGRLFAPVILGGDVSSYTTGIETRVVTFEGQGTDQPVYGDIIGCENDATVSSVSVKGVSQLPSMFYNGSHIGYSRVLEYAGNENTTIRGTEYPNGAIVSEFINEVSPHNLGDPFVPTIDLGHKNGKLLRQTVYKYVSDIANPTGLSPVSQTENVYTEEEYEGEKVFSMAYVRRNTFHCYVPPNSADYIPNYYELKPTWHYLTETIERQFFGDNVVSTSSKYGYPPDEVKPYYMYDSKEWQDSQDRTMRQEFTRHANYPALVTKAEVLRDNQQISGNQVTYYGKLPATVASWERGTTDTYRLLKRYNYVNNLLVVSEDFPTNNPLEPTYGLKKYYLWGYGGAFPVAEIVGDLTSLDLTGISQTLLDNPLDDATLRIHLDQLRNKPAHEKALITIYTYKPGVGVTSVTDPNGFTNIYEYDVFNRLILVKDQDNNIVQTYSYHYKGQ